MREIHIDRDKNGTVQSVDITLGPGINNGPGGATICPRYAGGWLVKFPTDAFSAENGGVKQAVLAHQNGIWALVVMHAVVEALFKGTSP